MPIAGGHAAEPLEWLSNAAARLSDLAGRVTDTVGAALSGRTLVAAAVVLAALAGVWLMSRLVTTRRALDPSRRLQLMALPTESFDPSPEEIDRYAAQLSRSRRTVRSALSRPAQAVRVRLDSVGDGRAVYRIEGLADAGSILRLSGYREVELRPADALDEEALRSLVDTPPDDADDEASPEVDGDPTGHRPVDDDRSRDMDGSAGRRRAPGEEGHR